MKKYQKEIIKLTSKELILSFFDIFTPFFEASTIYRKSTREYLNRRSVDRSNFLYNIRYWQRQGYVRSFIKGKDKYLELTREGEKYLKNVALDKLIIKRPKKWDGKWRVVIFDIIEKRHSNRDSFREKLKSMGFYPIQKSVYVYPFDCAKEIAEISDRFFIAEFVVIMISEIIQGEKKIINFFLDEKVLTSRDLKNK
jgi:DNA-binding PadR family transcriptional regulator